MDEQVNPLERDHCLCVVLPCGLEKTATVHGSKPVMDLVVTLCASYHLNPSDFTVELLSPNKNNISFKPNCPVGLLEAEKVVLKPKNTEEKIRRPYMPEATVRLLVNYNKSHKTVVRVNPRLPLELLLPVVCEKCEFHVETTVLLRDRQSKETLDLSKTLNELGLREVFAKDVQKRPPSSADTPAVTPSKAASPSPLQAQPKTEKLQKENSGFFSLFRRRKKKQDVDEAGSAPSGLSKQLEVSVDSDGVSSLPPEMPKKRRAPQPPMTASHSVPNNLSSCHLRGAQRSAESTLRSTKRRAPPPPSLQQPDGDAKGTVNSLNTVGELRQSDDSVNVSLSSSSSPHPSQPPSSFSRPSLAHLHEVADPFLPSFRGRDLSDARSALAKVLTSSVSKGTLVRRLKNSATFPKFQNGSPFLSTRSSDNRAVHADQSALTSDLPTEGEWEDPVQRRGLTTFKVVPPKKVQDPDVTLDVPDQHQIPAEDTPESEARPEAEEETSPPDRRSSTPSPRPEPCPQDIQASPPPLQALDCEDTPQTEDTSETDQGLDCEDTPQTEDTSETDQGLDCEDTPQTEDTSETDQGLDCEDTPQTEGEDATEKLEEEEELEVILPAPPDEDLTCEGQTSSEDQGGFLQSSGPNMDEEKTVEEDVLEEERKEEEEEEAIFPPPPPPVFFDEDTEVMEEEGDAASSLPQTPTMNGQTALSDVQQEDSASAEPDQPAEKKSSGPSRFAQAVAMAVQRSRLQGRSKGSGPCSALQSPARSTYQYGA